MDSRTVFGLIIWPVLTVIIIFEDAPLKWIVKPTVSDGR